MTQSRTFVLPLILLASLAASPTFAGLVKMSVDPNSCAAVGARDLDNKLLHLDAKCDVNGDGVIEFGIPPEKQKDTAFIRICKTSDAKDVYANLNFRPGETNLAFHEPFRMPAFGAVTPGDTLVAVADVSGFLEDVVPLAVGQILTVTNGGIPQTTTITFKDGSALSPPPDGIAQLSDPNFVSSLPDYSGNIEVLEPDTFLVTVIPTLSEWGLILFTVLLGGLGVLLVHRRVRLRAAQA